MACLPYGQELAGRCPGAAVPEDTGGQLGARGAEALASLSRLLPPAFTTGGWGSGEGLSAACPGGSEMGCLCQLAVVRGWRAPEFPRRSWRTAAFLKIGLLAWLLLQTVCCNRVSRALCKRAAGKSSAWPGLFSPSPL